ncbi:hypothetical protein Emag_006701 [Eimeria magna]
MRAGSSSSGRQEAFSPAVTQAFEVTRKRQLSRGAAERGAPVGHTEAQLRWQGPLSSTAAATAGEKGPPKTRGGPPPRQGGPLGAANSLQGPLIA